MAWATVADVTTLTGTTPTDPQLAAAQAVIEVHCNRTEAAADSFRLRDLVWLRQAVAWQAVWQAAQPGYETRQGIANASQDGASFAYRTAADQTLAPLAQRALKNCSWMGTRTLRSTNRRPRPTYDDLNQIAMGAFLHSGADPEVGWDPL